MRSTRRSRASTATFDPTLYIPRASPCSHPALRRLPAHRHRAQPHAGADTFYICALYLRAQWPRRSCRAALCTNVSGVVHTLAAVLGLSALPMTSAPVFAALKYLGAAYLVWLGLRMLPGTAHSSGKARHGAYLSAILVAQWQASRRELTVNVSSGQGESHEVCSTGCTRSPLRSTVNRRTSLEAAGSAHYRCAGCRRARSCHPHAASRQQHRACVANPGSAIHPQLEVCTCHGGWQGGSVAHLRIASRGGARGQRQRTVAPALPVAWARSYFHANAGLSQRNGSPGH
ncbi:hypothetical protein B0E48_00880 [Rhodanobacter sp. C03]|nr:hypothetical protein B0E48_00880 [Rhodanobacter sp. C03]